MKHIKYPKIRHLPGSKMSRGDKRLSEGEVEFLLSSPVHISEKVDGAIVAIGVENEIPQLFKRGGSVTNRDHIQFAEFKTWAYCNMHRIINIPTEWRIYGEWLSIKHTIAYDRLPDYFIAFDILTPNGFLKYSQVLEYLHEWDFYIPVQYDIELENVEDFVTSTFSTYSTTDIMEGVVVRDLENTLRGKWVRENFIQGEHWSAGEPQRNYISSGSSKRVEFTD
jgi:hypothetical protein